MHIIPAGVTQDSISLGIMVWCPLNYLSFVHSLLHLYCGKLVVVFPFCVDYWIAVVQRSELTVQSVAFSCSRFIDNAAALQ